MAPGEGIEAFAQHGPVRTHGGLQPWEFCHSYQLLGRLVPCFVSIDNALSGEREGWSFLCGNWRTCKGYRRFKERLPIKNFHINLFSNQVLISVLCSLFSLILALWGLSIPGAGIKSSVLFCGHWDASTIGPHSVDGEEMKKDCVSESCRTSWIPLEELGP